VKAGDVHEEQQEDGGARKGRAGRGSWGRGGSTGRELARRASKAGAAKRAKRAASAKERAEGAFGRALGLMVTELARLWRKRVDFRKGKPGAEPLTDDEEYRVWWLADKILVATKGVVPISATVGGRVDIPIIPAGMVQLLRGIAPGREALAELEAGEVVDAQARELGDPRSLATGRTETKAERRERNRQEWRQGQAERERLRREKKRREEAERGDTPAPPPNASPAPPGVRPPPTQGAPADPAPPTRPAPDRRDP